MIQARDNCTRLPKKATTMVGPKVMLQHIYDRLKLVDGLESVVVSTSDTSPEIIGYCKLNGIEYWVGPEDDLLTRHLRAAESCAAEAVLRITSDCIFHDPAMLSKMVMGFKKSKYVDALINWHQGVRSQSEGLDAEIVTVKCMERLDRDDECPREDWMTYLDNNESNYRVMGWRYPNKVGAEVHLSVDTPSDLERARKMIAFLGEDTDYQATLSAWRMTADES